MSDGQARLGSALRAAEAANGDCAALRREGEAAREALAAERAALEARLREEEERRALAEAARPQAWPAPRDAGPP